MSYERDHYSWMMPLFVIVSLLGLGEPMIGVVIEIDTVPGSMHTVSAEIADKDIDPTHEEFRQTTELEPVVVGTAYGVGLGIAAADALHVEHVPTRYSVLVRWDGGEAWLPTDGYAFRKLSMGSTVKLHLHEEQDVTLLRRLSPKLVAGPVEMPQPPNP